MFRALGEQLRKPSGTFGKIVAKMMDTRNREYYEKIISDLELKSGDNVYEIGYGPGWGIGLIADSTFDCSISGIDFSELMYSEATKRNQLFIDEGRVNLTYGDFLTASIDPETYDKVFCVNVIYFWSDLNRVFKKIYAMMNKEGLFCIFMTPDKVIAHLKFTEEFFKYPIKQVESELKKAGFNSVEHKLDKGYYIKARK
ncbi:MAG TPA: hypothetical protein DCL77_18555 [Prolixibacteraceae bacterium]|jgi:cyclopropane fatty-acyl-phospholipid synthase-like methyltransferase|nr:hypothetical protein [Prolixibacteraceae bacterium]